MPSLKLSIVRAIYRLAVDDFSQWERAGLVSPKRAKACFRELLGLKLLEATETIPLIGERELLAILLEAVAHLEPPKARHLPHHP